MTDHGTDEIRELLEREMSDSPDPVPWADVERRARRLDTPPSARRRTGVWLAVAACTVALVGGLVAVLGPEDEPTVRTDDPTDTTTKTAPLASAPTPTAGTIEAGSTGGLLDPLAEAAPSGTDTAQSDGGPNVAAEQSGETASQADSDIGRPLAELDTGDVVVPTYLPPGRTFNSAMFSVVRRGVYSFSFLLERADPQTQHPASTVSLYESNEPLGPLGPQLLDDPNHPPVDIAGITWGWNDFFGTRVAHIGPFEVMASLDGLDRSQAQRFIEGLRAVPLEQYPVPISFQDDTYPDDLANAEIVASDDRFELAALQVGGHACMKLEETDVPAPRTFAPNCWRALSGSGIVDVYPSGDTGTEFLLIGVIDSSVATTVRVTSPDGDSVVVPTGPVNQATYGRFFLARLDLDDSDGIRLDQFTIEDASP